MSTLLESLVEIKLIDESSFLKIKETLSRIGIPLVKDGTKQLFQSCHILHKQGRYYIVHFKELFALDRKPHDFTMSDKARRNTIVHLLEEWGLCEVLDHSKMMDPRAPMSGIKVISYKEKDEWQLKSKYSIGKRHSSGPRHEEDWYKPQ